MWERSRMWLGGALTLAGAFLYYDAETFLGTRWSRNPISAVTELKLACFLIAAGIVTLFATALARMVSSYAPDPSLQMARDITSDSVELRLRDRLPLRLKLSMLPDRGLVGGALVLLLLVPMSLIITPPPSTGIYVQLVSRAGSWPDENCIARPIVVAVKRHDASAQISVNGAEVSRSAFQQVLKSNLATRAQWEVFVEADDSMAFADLMDAIDTIHSLPANAVLLTPKLKEQLVQNCPLP